MKKFAFILLFALTAVYCFAYPAFSEESSSGKAGILIGDSAISPGDKKEYIFAFLGVPDGIYAMRGKGSKKNDYVKLYYQEYDLSFDLSNEDNVIKAIILKGDLRLQSIPFKIGDSYDDVKNKWGEPDKKEAGYANYVKKGVMFKISDTGIIELIAIFPPGTLELTPPSQSEQA